MNYSATPSVLFVCVKNSGKSQMAAGLMRKIVGDSVQVYSAGTKPGDGINALSAESLAEVGVDIGDERPKPIDAQLLRDVDFVITLGREAHLEPVPGPRFENWDTDEPSERGIDGIERTLAGHRLGYRLCRSQSVRRTRYDQIDQARTELERPS